MRSNYLYTLLLCILFFGCKHDTTKCPKCPECPKAHVEEVMTSTKTHKFLSLSDVHINGNMSGTQYGNVTGTQLWSRAKAKIENVVKAEQPKFMVYLGDLPAYIDDKRAENSHTMLENLRGLQIGIPILYLPGNNDSLEGDYHSFTNGNGDTVLTEDKNVSNQWPIINSSSTVIRAINLNFNKEFGYYSVDLVDNGNVLKVIALNTVIFSSKTTTHHGTEKKHIAYDSKKNTAGDYAYGDDGVSQQKATQDQMHWFEAQLKNLGANDRVMIMMHIPIGIDGYGGTNMWNTNLTYKDLSGTVQPLHNGFVGLIAKYQPNITGLLNGHTHTDGLRRIYKTAAPTPSGTPNNPKDMVSFSISTPGIAVNHDNNPAFKIFTYDSSNYTLLDFETYYASPTNTAATGDFKFLQNSSYTFNNVYGVKSANTPIFNTLANETDPQVVKHVNTTLGTMSNQDVKLIYDNAVDVHKN